MSEGKEAGKFTFASHSEFKQHNICLYEDVKKEQMMHRGWGGGVKILQPSQEAAEWEVVRILQEEEHLTPVSMVFFGHQQISGSPGSDVNSGDEQGQPCSSGAKPSTKLGLTPRTAEMRLKKMLLCETTMGLCF